MFNARADPGFAKGGGGPWRARGAQTYNVSKVSKTYVDLYSALYRLKNL